MPFYSASADDLVAGYSELRRVSGTPAALLQSAHELERCYPRTRTGEMHCVAWVDPIKDERTHAMERLCKEGRDKR
jgi:hypothetical protein